MEYNDDDDEGEGEEEDYTSASRLALLQTLLRLQAPAAANRQTEDKEETKVEPPSNNLNGSDLTQRVRLRTGNDKQGRYKHTMAALHTRELGGPPSKLRRTGDYFNSSNLNAHIAQRYMPDTCQRYEPYEARVFCGKFSTDGEVYMTAAQDAHVRLYNTQTNKCFKDIECRGVRWAVLDVDYSPDNRRIIYCTWSRFVHLCNVVGDYELHEALDFRPELDRFCFFSVKFSPDNREIVGGCNEGYLMVYDLESNQRVVNVQGHSTDINAVAWSDPSSQTIYTGSDDTLIKVWDRRMLHDSDELQKPQGVLPGHHHGITCIDSKGDGRYLVSNSKDQSMKLWDTRTMKDADSDTVRDALNSSSQWDYRWHLERGAFSRLIERTRKPRASDVSLMTYTGHRVMDTLIRGYFSPVQSTGQKYVYVGSHCGSIFVYDVLTGQRVKRLMGHTETVRDVSWHPSRPLILSSSWDGSTGRWVYLGQPSPPPSSAAAASTASSSASSSSSGASGGGGGGNAPEPATSSGGTGTLGSLLSRLRRR